MRSSLALCHHYSQATICHSNFQGRGNIGKTCKTSGEKLLFFTAKFVCDFSVKCGEIMQFHRYSKRCELTKSHRFLPPLQGFETLTFCMSCTSSSTALSFTNFYYFCFKYKSISLYFLQNMRSEFL